MSGPAQKPAAASVKGWCPGALRPMESGDGLLVRLRPRLARLSRAQVLGLCSLSETYAAGLIDLTRRANLQIRGVQPATYEPLIAALDGLGLLDADPAQESRRNLLVTPFWTAGDPTEYAARALLAALSSLLAGLCTSARDASPTCTCKCWHHARRAFVFHFRGMRCGLSQSPKTYAVLLDALAGLRVLLLGGEVVDHA